MITNGGVVYCASNSALIQESGCLEGRKRGEDLPCQTSADRFILCKTAGEKTFPSAAVIKVLVLHIKNICFTCHVD